jgi:hypothetical protein
MAALDGTTNPQMTVAKLREQLNAIEAKYGNMPVTIWLPGSRIDLHQVMSLVPMKGEILIEGNVRDGSALS